MGSEMCIRDRSRRDSFQIQKKFFEDFEKIENEFIGLPATEVTRENYFYEIQKLKTEYKLLSGINFETPPSKLTWNY